MLSSLHDIKRRKMTAFILLIDFEKAFDSVPIPCLIIKLHNNGVGSKFLELILSFLTNRSVQLKVNGFIGPRRKYRLIGLPQGAVLSPLLFILLLYTLQTYLAQKIFLLTYLSSLNVISMQMMAVCL